MLEAAAEHGKAVWVLDRPNPAGRPVEGTTLLPGWESFVGAGPMPMRHGLTLGELGHWFIDHFKLDVDYRVIEMEGWQPDAGPGFGWPADRVWINPSPNAAQPQHGALLCRHGDARRRDAQRGQGHHPPARTVRRARHRRARGASKMMRDFAPQWLDGCSPARDLVRADLPQACRHSCATACKSMPRATSTIMQAFSPWRLQALAFKAIRTLFPDYELWRDFPYEYVFGKLAIDVINGGPALARMGRRCGQRSGRSGRAARMPDEAGLGRADARPFAALLTLAAQLPHRLVEPVERQRVHALVHQPLEDRGRGRMAPIWLGRRVEPGRGGIGGRSAA